MVEILEEGLGLSWVVLQVLVLFAEHLLETLVELQTCWLVAGFVVTLVQLAYWFVVHWLDVLLLLLLGV